MYNIKQLRRLRWTVLSVVLAGIGASIAMNVLHAPDSLSARLVSAGPPLAVFASLELIARIPSSSRWLTRSRIAGAVIVAAGAATISYAQQKAAVQALGFAEWEAWIWPLIIDGLMIVASVSLVEVVRLIRNMTNPAAQATMSAPVPVVAESAEVLAYRAARGQLRTESFVPALNGRKA